jgi:hypothetical protein
MIYSACIQNGPFQIFRELNFKLGKQTYDLKKQGLHKDFPETVSDTISNDFSDIRK